MPGPPFEHVAWREALRPARGGALEGRALVGPRGLVADRIRAAVTPLRRVRGLIGRAQLGSREALVLRPCSQVHGIGMRYPFDAVFCNDELEVLAVATIAPRRVSPHVRGATCCIELRAGRARECGVEPGARLSLGPTP